MTTERCWCGHPETGHGARGCTSCRGARSQVLDWRHLFRCIGDQAEKRPRPVFITTKPVFTNAIAGASTVTPRGVR